MNDEDELMDAFLAAVGPGWPVSHQQLGRRPRKVKSVASVRVGDIIEWAGHRSTVLRTHPYVAKHGASRKKGTRLDLRVEGKGEVKGVQYYLNEKVTVLESSVTSDAAHPISRAYQRALQRQRLLDDAGFTAGTEQESD